MFYSPLKNDYDLFSIGMKGNNYCTALSFVRAILASN